MMQSDSKTPGVDAETIIGNSDIMNIDMMSEIENELQDNPYDMVSLVFLLYDVPDTALQRLTVFQRVSNDVGTSLNLNMLHEWFRHAKHNPNWKHEFVEALLICQLYGIVRKIGFNVPSARKHYQTDNINVKMYINPMKKALYKLCESINSDNLLKLKKTLLTYNIDTAEYESCELIILKLMCEKFITINQYQYNKKVLGYKVHVDKLLRIVESLPGLKKLVLEIKILQQSMNDEPEPGVPVTTSTPATSMKVDDESNKGQAGQKYHHMDFDDVYEMLGDLRLDDVDFDTLKSDRKQLGNDSYEIKNNKRVGVCLIINQENFYPSKSSIEITGASTLLDKRKGSEKDKLTLEKTMSSLNFKVISYTDLDHKKMIEVIVYVIKSYVNKDDSIFMLCILSHGVRGPAVYAADSVRVKMDDIQNLLDSDDAINIHDKPKLLIVQACQVDETPHPILVADNPKSRLSKKSNFLTYYATAPDLEAYRIEEKGSIFIQILCRTISKYAKVEHVFDIFTKVNNYVVSLCNKIGYDQVPQFNSTLRKKLYLQIPH